MRASKVVEWSLQHDIIKGEGENRLKSMKSFYPNSLFYINKFLDLTDLRKQNFVSKYFGFLYVKIVTDYFPTFYNISRPTR